MASRGIPNFQNGREKGPYFCIKWVPLVEKLSIIPLHSENINGLISQESQININYNPS